MRPLAFKTHCVAKAERAVWARAGIVLSGSKKKKKKNRKRKARLERTSGGKKKNERLLIVLVLSTSSLPSLFPLSLSRFPLFFLFFTGKMKKYVIVFRKSALSYKLSFPIRETLNEKREKKPLSFPFTSLRSPQSLALPLPPFCSRRSSAPPAAASSRSGRCSPGRESPSKPPTPGCPWRPGAAPGSSAARAPPAAGRPSRSPFSRP